MNIRVHILVAIILYLVKDFKPINKLSIVHMILIYIAFIIIYELFTKKNNTKISENFQNGYENLEEISFNDINNINNNGTSTIVQPPQPAQPNPPMIQLPIPQLTLPQLPVMDPKPPTPKPPTPKPPTPKPPTPQRRSASTPVTQPNGVKKLMENVLSPIVELTPRLMKTIQNLDAKDTAKLVEVVKNMNDPQMSPMKVTDETQKESLTNFIKQLDKIKQRKMQDDNGTKKIVPIEVARNDMKYDSYKPIDPTKLGNYVGAAIPTEYKTLPQDEGWSIFPPEKWYPVPPHPPLCIVEKECPVCPVFTSGSHVDALEWRGASKILPPDNINMKYIAERLNSRD